jgi:hypothetical protein
VLTVPSAPPPPRLPQPPQSARPELLLVGECNTVIAQLAHALALRDAIQKDELQRVYDALKAAKTEFKAIVRVGRALQAAKEAIAQRPLSEQVDLTLADRHAVLVQKVTAACEELLAQDDLDALDTLATKLEELKALDVSFLQHSWATDPLQPPVPPTPTAAAQGEADGANDHVYVPPHADEITLPCAHGAMVEGSASLQCEM